MFGYENAIYYLIATDICQKIVRGEINPGDKLPTVREFAKDKQVNPNTIQKSYQLLQEQGIVMAIERSGKYVTEDTKLLAELKVQILTTEINKFVNSMEMYHFSEEQVLQQIKEEYEKVNRE